MSYFILCPPPLRELLTNLSDEWDEMMWKASPERKENAKLRLAAHDKALKEGYDSPYVDPDNYDINWKPIVIRHK